jgi:hypothetical protein
MPKAILKMQGKVMTGLNTTCERRFYNCRISIPFPAKTIMQRYEYLRIFGTSFTNIFCTTASKRKPTT